jgi:MFS family permease
MGGTVPDFPASSAPPHPTSVRWRILALLLLYSFMSWFNRVSMSAAYDERIQAELGISEEAIGYVYSALLFAYMLCMTPGGWFADHCGARLALTVMGFGSALFVALTGAVGLALRSVTAIVIGLLVVRAALGVFTAPIYPASGHAIARWFPARQRAAANGVVMGSALLGIAICYHAFGILLDLFDWPAAFLLTGALTALLALLWVGYARDLPAQHPQVNSAELHWIRADTLDEWPGKAKTEGIGVANALPLAREDAEITAAAEKQPLLMNRSLILLTVSYAAVGYFEYLFYFWMHYYFGGVLKLGKYESRNSATILYVAMAAGMFLGGWLADDLAVVWGRRRGRAAVVVGGMLGGAVFLVGGLLATQAGWIVLWFALAMASVGAVEGPMWATALELGGRRGATAAGIFNTGGNAGGVLAPVLTPLVSNAYGWPWGIGVGSLVCLAGVCLWRWIDPEEALQKPKPSPS